MDSAPGPSATTEDVARVEAFLLWARDNGFAFEAIRIGGIELVGARDLVPSVKARVAATAAAEAQARADDWPDSAYDKMPGADKFLERRSQ